LIEKPFEGKTRQFYRQKIEIEKKVFFGQKKNILQKYFYFVFFSDNPSKSLF